MLAVNTTRSYHWDTMSRKKSTCGRLCTKNLTGWRSMRTLTLKSWKNGKNGWKMSRKKSSSKTYVKSCGVPGFTLLFLGTASWCEWIKVSSRSSTSTFLWTMLNRCLETGDKGYSSYLTGWCWMNFLVCLLKTQMQNPTNLLNKLTIFLKFILMLIFCTDWLVDGGAVLGELV